MNLIDRIVGWFSPEAGAQREAWRQVLQEYRNYDAGSHGRANANWRVFNQSAEYTDRYSRDTVRARARDLERNSDMMNSVIGPFIRNIVGKGLVLQANTGSEPLNKEIEKLWRVWCKKRNCDVTGTQSLNQMRSFHGPSVAKMIEKVYSGGQVTDEGLKAEIARLYQENLQKQIDKAVRG